MSEPQDLEDYKYLMADYPMVDQRKADGVTSDAREKQRAVAVKALKTRNRRKAKKRVK